MSLHPASSVPDHLSRYRGVEVIRGRKARLTVLRPVEDTPSGVGVMRFARAMLTLVLLSSTAGAGGVLLIHSDGWRHDLPPPMAKAVGQVRSALLHALYVIKG